MGANYLEFDRFVPKTGLQFYKGKLVCVWWIVCVLPLFLPVDAQHNETTSVRADSSILSIERYKLSGHNTTPQRNYSSSTLIGMQYAEYIDNAMPCLSTGYDRHDIHVLYNKEKTKEANKKQTAKNTCRTRKRKKKKKKYRASPQGMWQTLDKNS